MPNRRALEQVIRGYISYWHDRNVKRLKPGTVRIDGRHVTPRQPR